MHRATIKESLCGLILFFALLCPFVQATFAFNFISNPSFEELRSPSVPKKWYRVTPRHCPAPDELQSWFSLWRLDDTHSLYGQKSLCITLPAGSQLDWWDLGAWQRVYIPGETSYKRFLILSVYLRADKPYFRASLFVRYPLIQKTVEVGSDWKRYYLAIPLSKEDFKVLKRSKDKIGKERICIGPVSSGKLWIDCVQFELTDVEYPTKYKRVCTGVLTSSTQKKFDKFASVPTNLRLFTGPNVLQVNSSTTSGRSEKTRRIIPCHYLPIAAHFGRSWTCSPYLEMLKRSNFNTVCIQMYPRSARRWALPSIETIRKCKEALDNIHSEGLSAVVWISFGISYAITQGKNPAIAFAEYKMMMEDLIKRFKYHPAIKAWYIFDEPGPGKCKLWGVTRKELERAMLDLYSSAKKMDPTRPVMINFANFMRTGYGADATDVALVDKYCKKPDDVSKYYHTARRLVVDSHGRPPWMWLHLKVADHPIIELSAPEFQSMVYQALVAGVRGFFYFTGIPDSLELWHQVRQTNAELHTLSALVLSNPRMRAVPLVHDNTRSPVKAVCLRSKNDYFLITVNSGGTEVDMRFNLNGLTQCPNQAAVLFEGRKRPILGNVIEDCFRPFERHVYHLRGHSGD